MKGFTMKICSIAIALILIASTGILNPSVRVYAEEEPASGIQLPNGAVITDTAMHTSQPVMYAVDNANSKVYAINYETETISEVSFDLKPERIKYNNGKLYVTLLEAPHNPYPENGLQPGAIEILDAAELSLIKHIDIDIDPFDIAVSGDYIYIASGSAQWTSIKTYSETTEQAVSAAGIRERSYIELNPVLNKIYTITTDTSPRDYTAYNISNGVFGSIKDSPYHGEYTMKTNFRLSPDGMYIFNGSGLILSCNADVTKDMRFIYMLDKPFSDITFDTTDDKFYTAVPGKMVYSYDYNTYNGGKAYHSQGEIVQLYSRDSKLIALSCTDEGQYIVEKLDVSDNAGIPKQDVATKRLTKNGTKYELYYIVKDSAIHPINTVVYVTDVINNKLAAINYKTGEVKEINTTFAPDSIAYHNDELYVGYGRQGKVDIYDAQTLQFKDVIYTRDIFLDMTIGRDGFIYTSSEIYARSFSRVSKQEVSNIYINNQGYLEVHPTIDSLYFTSIDVSPMDMYSVNYNNGSLVRQYDSPYHGDYRLNENNSISPDGKYIFNGAGIIFKTSSYKTSDMIFYRRLNMAFSDAAFDIANDRFYLGATYSAIEVYKYSTLQSAGVYPLIGKAKKLYQRSNKLIVISEADDQKNYIEFVTLPAPIDCTNDGVINIDDLTILSLAYNSDINDGSGRYNAKADFDKNGRVDYLDLAQLIQYYDI